MRKTHRYTVFLLGIILGIAGRLPGSDVISDFTGQYDQQNEVIRLTWNAANETGVDKYQIERDGGDGYFIIGHVEARGKGTYEYEDKIEFAKPVDGAENNVYHYRIRVMYQNGTNQLFQKNVTVYSQLPMGIRQTWGSIKAMFK